MNHTYRTVQLNFFKNEDPKEFFNWCLENKLYKEDSNDEFFKSRMKEVYLGNKQYDGISAIIAYDEDKPIGICLLEQKIDENGSMPITRGGLLHMDNRERKNPWQKRFDLEFIHLGFLSFYVKEEYRRKGIAKQLLSDMEELQYNRLKVENFPEKILENLDKHYITVTARELASKIVENSKFFLSSAGEYGQKRYNSSIASYSYEIVFNEKELNTMGSYKQTKEEKNKMKIK